MAESIQDLSSKNITTALLYWNKHYLSYLQAIKATKNTIDSYSRLLESFFEYMREYDEEVTLRSIKSVYITSFLSRIEDKSQRGLSKRTKQTYIYILRSFFHYIANNSDDLLSFDDLFKKIHIKGQDRQETKIKSFTQEESGRFKTFLLSYKHKSQSYSSCRDIMLIKLMFYAGLRVSEALHTTLDSFKPTSDPDIMSIKIQWKGDSMQHAFIQKSVIEEELEYFAHYHHKSNERRIFITKNNQQLDRFAAYKICQKFYRQAGIFKKGCHLLRHSFAMDFVRLNKDILLIKDLLRHSNITTTMVYAKVEKKQLFDVLKEV